MYHGKYHMRPKFKPNLLPNTHIWNFLSLGKLHHCVKQREPKELTKNVIFSCEDKKSSIVLCFCIITIIPDFITQGVETTQIVSSHDSQQLKTDPIIFSSSPLLLSRIREKWKYAAVIPPGPHWVMMSRLIMTWGRLFVEDAYFSEDEPIKCWLGTWQHSGLSGQTRHHSGASLPLSRLGVVSK